MTINRKTSRRHGAGTLAGPGMAQINSDWRKANRAAEDERILKQRRIAEQKARYAKSR